MRLGSQQASDYVWPSARDAPVGKLVVPESACLRASFRCLLQGHGRIGNEPKVRVPDNESKLSRDHGQRWSKKRAVWERAFRRLAEGQKGRERQGKVDGQQADRREWHRDCKCQRPVLAVRPNHWLVQARYNQAFQKSLTCEFDCSWGRAIGPDRSR